MLEAEGVAFQKKPQVGRPDKPSTTARKHERERFLFFGGRVGGVVCMCIMYKQTGPNTNPILLTPLPPPIHRTDRCGGWPSPRTPTVREQLREGERVPPSLWCRLYVCRRIHIMGSPRHPSPTTFRQPPNNTTGYWVELVGRGLTI